MKFSICMPAYNAEKTISRAIESVLKQTYTDYELVIVDDGSNDNTSSIVSDFQKKDARIKFIYGKKMGLFKARLECLKNAIGEYIVFLDSDDFLEKQALEVIDNTAEACEADIIQYCAREKKLNGKSRQMQVLFPDKTRLEGLEIDEMFDSLVTTERYTTLWNKAIRRTCFELDALGECPDVSIGEDNIIMLYVMKNARSYYYITDILYNYMVYGGCTRVFRGDSYDNLIKRLEAKRKAILYAGKEIEQYREVIELYQIRSAAKIVAYYPNRVGKSDEQVRVFYDVLNQIKKDSLFWELFIREKRKVSILYRVPLVLLYKGKYRMLLCYKRMWETIRKVII